FIAEFLCFYGAWLKFPVLALLSVFGIVLTAIYVLRMLQKIFLGPFQEATYPHLSDARTTEWVAISALAVLLLIVGIYPRPLVDLIPTGFKALPGMEQARPSTPALLPAREKGAKHPYPPSFVTLSGAKGFKEEILRSAQGDSQRATFVSVSPR